MSFSFHGSEHDRTLGAAARAPRNPGLPVPQPYTRRVPNRRLGDAASAAADAQIQMVGLAAFFAGVNSGQAPNPQQLATASTAVAQIQTDLVSMGATPAPTAVAAAGGITKMQAGLIAAGAVLVGIVIDRAMK